MAHECIYCDGVCHCGGDIDDIQCMENNNCRGCGCQNEEPEYDDDDDYDPLESEFEHCTCGAYVLSDKGNIIKISDCYC